MEASSDQSFNLSRKVYSAKDSKYRSQTGVRYQSYGRLSSLTSQSIKVFTDVEELLRDQEYQKLTVNTQRLTRGDSVSTQSRPDSIRNSIEPVQISPLSPPPLFLPQKRVRYDNEDNPESPTPSYRLYDEDIRNPRNAPRSSFQMSKSARDYRRQPFLHSEPLASFKDLFPAIQTRAYEENQRRVNVDKRLPEPPFHVFCFKKKILLTCLVSVAGLLSPMSGSIYFPAITAVVEEFGINGCVGLLTVTVHVVVHGIAPFLSTPLSERWGRRPILIAAMLVFSGANIGLVFVKNLAGFFLLRALQSLGAAPLPLIGAAIIGDMATTEESRTLTTLFSSVLLLSLLISPVIGGALTQWMGLHCMFWFLFALSAVVFILVIIILPETHRGIAGNGTIKLAKLRQPLFNILRQSSDTAFDADTNLAPANLSISSFIEPLRYLVNWQLVPSLLIGAVAFGIVATVVTTTAPLFQARYNLSILLSGLAYLPGAVGCSLGYFLTTYRVRSDYSIIEARYKRTHGIAEHVTMDASYLSRGFPIEHARFRSAWWITLIFIGTTSGYGFALQAPSIARALILQTFVTGNATAILLINGVYISDLYPGASVITIVNLVRFLMAGLMIGVIQKVFKLLETGLTFSILAGIMLFLSPIMILQWKYGPRLREKNHESSEDLADMLKPIV